LWNSRRYDESTDLYYYKYRHYKADIGRWLGRDPIEEDGGYNLYGFVENEPISKFDEYGQKPKLKYTDVTSKAVGADYCGKFDWTVQWSLTGATKSGLIVQTVERKGDIVCCTKGTSLFNIPEKYTEYWKVTVSVKGVVSLTPITTDTWALQVRFSDYKTKKKIEYKGEAVFYEGLTSYPAGSGQGVSGYTPQGQPISGGGHQSSGVLHSQTGHVWPQGKFVKSNKVKRKLTASFDCCQHPIKTKVK